jgi:NDP-sugar pyrophosphorylase family protein
MGVIRSDPFVLISGDVISNINLEKVIQFHTKKKKEDSNALMTVVFKKVQPTTGIKQVTSLLMIKFVSFSYIFIFCRLWMI